MDNNVQERIDDYLDQVFGPYEDSPTVAELRIEVRHDLLERLADLIDHGVGDEVAYAQVVSSVGDIGITIRELAEQDRADEQDQAAEEGSSTGSTTEGTNGEPQGPASSIPESDAPGATWSEQERPADAPPTYADWTAAVADLVTTGLQQAREQFTSAMRQAEEALNQAGVTPDDIRHGRNRDWQRRWERTERHTRTSFASSNMRGADFSHQQLPNATFASSNLPGANFSSADLAGASFRASNLRNADFTQANLSGANLNACSLRNVQFERANLTGASLTCSDMRNSVFTGVCFKGTKATYADLRSATFSDCLMEGATFTGSDLRMARFDGLALTDITFDMANLALASFRGSTLRHVSFRFVSRQCVQKIVFEDTVMDQITYLSLRTSGCTPSGVRVEN
ncbi:MAG: pentapeptide repeat-containing protein [Propionibacteriaceae bacterium]|nr:pentapeptide repeat-containing protein [Propionibacteriaceae bacterium]